MKKPLSQRLNRRITIRRSTRVKTPTLGHVTTWTDVGTVWAEVIGMDGRESVMDRVLQGVSVFKITIRWRGDVLTSDQLRAATAAVFGGRDVNVRSAVDPTGEREELLIMADTAQTHGG